MTDGWSYELVPLADGRRLEVLVRGDQERGFVNLSGTPGGATPDEALARDCDEAGLRAVLVLRPGYGQSSPCPGRRVVDVVEDVDAVLSHLGIDEAVCMGGSGGGPHALAVAARSTRVRACAVLVSPAPRDAEGLDFYDGMALSNQEEWRLADSGEEQLRPYLEKTVQALSAGPEAYLELFGDNISAEDAEVMAGGGLELMATRIAKAVECGVEGWLEDDIALTTPWGFDLEEITTPVSLWAGKEDQFVSYRHTAWLGQRVRTGDVHLYAGEGHLSLRLRLMPVMLQDLLEKAGWV